ncbi:MAG TPA: peptidoglycan DD-metalloendopeptidase family protein [Nevskiaceae bacterium]
MPGPRKRVGLARAVCVAATLVLAAPLMRETQAAEAPRGDAHTSIQQRRQELSKVEAQIRAAAHALEQARGRQGQLQGAVNAAEKRIVHARADLKDLRSRTEAMDARLDANQQRRSRLQSELTAQRQTLAEQLRAQYMIDASGADSPLRLLMSSQDAGEAGRMLTYYQYLGRARALTIEQVQSRLSSMDQVESQMAAQRQSLARLDEQHEKALAELQQEQEKRSHAVAQLKEEIDSKGAELDNLRASERQIRKLLDTLTTQLASAPYRPPSGVPFAKLRGKLEWPVRGPLLARFGALRAGGPLTWKGLWIGAAEGAPVHAAAAGRVAYVGWLSSYGLIVLLEHEGGYFTLYGHNASAGVHLGETVAAGQQIATAGDTGGYDRSGVYFEIRHDSDAINPLGWLHG